MAKAEELTGALFRQIVRRECGFIGAKNKTAGKQRFCIRFLVEHRGLEPLTSWLPATRSPS